MFLTPRLLCFLLCLPIYGHWQPIFNGRNLDGWQHEGPRMTFSARENMMVVHPEGFPPNWLHTVKEYENFRMRFQYKLAQWGEAAVILRAPRVGRPMQAGISIYLAHDYHQELGMHGTGSIAGVAPPANPKKFGFNEWHRVEIACVGDHLRVLIDDVEKQNVSLATDPELRLRPKRGFVGFPAMGYGYALRQVELEELDSSTKFVELFNGASLEGWTLRGGGTWFVKDGAVHGANGDGVLYAPGQFANFELTALVRTQAHVNSGIFLRGSADLKESRGFEVQIFDSPDSVFPTGSFYNIARSRQPFGHEGEWFFLQVRVEGTGGVVRMNGETVATTNALPVTAAGRIGLQIHMENAAVAFRDLRVRPLP